MLAKACASVTADKRGDRKARLLNYLGMHYLLVHYLGAPLLHKRALA
jgi:hypothetical protein